MSEQPSGFQPDDQSPPAGMTPEDTNPPAGATPVDGGEVDPSGDSGDEVPADSLPTVKDGDQVQEPVEGQSPADEPDETADQSSVPDDSGLGEEDDGAAEPPS